MGAITSALNSIQTVKVKDPSRLEYWREIIEAWEKSGEKKVPFCEKRNISQTQFAYCRTKLNKLKREGGPVALNPVNVLSKQWHFPTPTWALCLNLPNGITIKVNIGADEKTLMTVLRLLGGTS